MVGLNWDYGRSRSGCVAIDTSTKLEMSVVEVDSTASSFLAEVSLGPSHGLRLKFVQQQSRNLPHPPTAVAVGVQSSGAQNVGRKSDERITKV